MLKINRKSDYAVRVLFALASEKPGTRLTTMAIQESMLIPHAFLQRIVADLSNSELIETFPGPSGGLSLAKPASQITLWDIISAVDGPIMISDCLEEPEDCALQVTCPVRSRWEMLQDLILHELKRTDLQQLADEAFEKKNKATFMEMERISSVSSN